MKPTKSIALFRRSAKPVTRKRSDRGAGLVEYAILVVLVAITAIGVTKAFGGTLVSRMGFAQNKLNGVDDSAGAAAGGGATK